MLSTCCIADIIERKRDGHVLTHEEIQSLVTAACDGTAEPAQLGAWLMACYLKGLNKEETVCLTHSMMHSGHIFTWPKEWQGKVVDKHSTGGVGDKVSLVLAPALAVAGLKVPMISGRGLGHTGGTLDKLQSIPGFNVNISMEHVNELMKSVGCCIVGQTEQLVPADRVLYSIRDVTATVANTNLITASIISKKAAEGLDVLVLDVKTGSGAFMKSMEQAFQLASILVDVGCGMGIKTAAVISCMESPLGNAVGNALEVAESVLTLQGRGPKDLVDIVQQTGGLCLLLSGQVKSKEEGASMISDIIADGSALSKFKDMLIAQGTSKHDADHLCNIEYDPWDVLVRAKYTTELTCPMSGYVDMISALDCAHAAQLLGSGRQRQSDVIDMAVGLLFTVSLGQPVEEGTPWVIVHHSMPSIPNNVLTLLQGALSVVPEMKSPVKESKVLEIIYPEQKCA